MKVSINLKLAAVILSLLFLQSAVVLWINYSSIRHDLVESAKIKYQLSANALQQYLSFLGQENKVIQIQETVAALGADTDIDVAYLADEKNRVIAATHLRDIGKTLNKLYAEAYYKRIVANIADVRFTLKSRLWISADKKKLFVASPVPLGKTSSDVLRINRIGVVINQVNLDSIRSHVYANLLRESVPVIFVLALFVLAIYVLVHYLITSRISRLQNYASMVRVDEDIEKHHDEGNDEIGILVDSFNTMLADIKQTYDCLATNL